MIFTKEVKWPIPKSKFEGKRFDSLSRIAREITGTPWSGPVFFNLRKTTRGKDFGDTIDEAQATVAMIHVEKVWSQLFPDEQSRIVKMLVDKVIVDHDNIQLHLRSNGIQELAHEFMPVKQLTLEAHCGHA